MKPNKVNTLLQGRTARIATGKGSGSVTPVSVIASRRDSPSDLWKAVKAQDIGDGFVPIEAVAKQKELERIERKNTSWKNKFVIGSSPHIFFTVIPKVSLSPKKAKIKTPINLSNKVSRVSRKRFIESLGRNLDKTARFVLKDLLPMTMSLESAMTRVQEQVHQMADTKIDLPTSVLKSKMVLASHLRITRFVSEIFELTEKEREIMVLELTRPWSHT